MKKSLLLIIVFISVFVSTSYACFCSINATITYQYQTSDFVASVKIIKNYKNDTDTSEYYKADIEIIDLYKGKKLKSIYVLGSNGNSTYNSCGTFIKEGETRLIFGNYNKGNNISTLLCNSYYKPLELNYRNNHITEKLTLLKKGAKNYRFDFFNEIAIYPYDFKQIYNPQHANHFSLIKINLDRAGKIEAIDYVTKESNQLKTIYESYFRETFDWERRLKRIKETSGRKTTLYIEINPYTSTKPKSLDN